MTSFMLALSWSTKASLTSKTINYIKFFPHNNSTTRFFLFLNHKRAVIKTEIFTVHLEQHWKYFFFQEILLSLLCIPEHKYISVR